MELYLKVRLACSEGMTQRQAAKHFNISRDSVAKMLSYSTPPGYRRRSPIRRPKLEAFVSTVDRWLDEDVKVPRKQRHTAKRVFDRLRDECGFTGGYTIIKDYIREREQRRQTETIGERLLRDLAAMRPLPASPLEACDQASARVTAQSLVRYKTNDYSVPVAFGHQEVWVRGYVDEVVIGCRGEIIARHPRSWEREDVVFDPLHYLPLIERKINALDQAAPLQGEHEKVGGLVGSAIA